MAESVKNRMAAMPGNTFEKELAPLMVAILADLTSLRTLLNTHVHSGVTVGAGNTGVPTSLAAALTLTA